MRAAPSLAFAALVALSHLRLAGSSRAWTAGSNAGSAAWPTQARSGASARHRQQLMSGSSAERKGAEPAEAAEVAGAGDEAAAKDVAAAAGASAASSAWADAAAAAAAEGENVWEWWRRYPRRHRTPTSVPSRARTGSPVPCAPDATGDRGAAGAPADARARGDVQPHRAVLGAAAAGSWPRRPPPATEDAERLLTGLGPWALANEADAGQHPWLAKALDYSITFDVKAIRWRPGARQVKVATFGAWRNQRDFAWVCRELVVLGRGVVAGPLMRHCSTMGCDRVASPLEDELVRLGRSRIAPGTPLLCNFTFEPSIERPATVTWRIVPDARHSPSGGHPVGDGDDGPLPPLIIVRLRLLDAETTSVLFSQAEQEVQIEPFRDFGHWVSASKAQEQKHPWLRHLAMYRANFHIKTLTLHAGHRTKTAAFGGQRSTRDFAWLCTHLSWHGAVAMGELGLHCGVRGCARVTTPLREHLRRAGADLERRLACRFTFDDDVRPSAVRWEIATPQCFGEAARRPCRPLVSIQLRRGGDDEIVSFDETGVAAQVQAQRLRHLGPWSPVGPGAAQRRRLLRAAEAYPLNFDYKKLRVGLERRSERGVAFGGQRHSKDFAWLCARMRLHSKGAVGELLLHCIGAGCHKVVNPLLRLFPKGFRVPSLWRRPPVCNFTFDDAEHPQTVTWEILTAPTSPTSRGTRRVLLKFLLTPSPMLSSRSGKPSTSRSITRGVRRSRRPRSSSFSSEEEEGSEDEEEDVDETQGDDEAEEVEGADDAEAAAAEDAAAAGAAEPGVAPGTKRQALEFSMDFVAEHAAEAGIFAGTFRDLQNDPWIQPEAFEDIQGASATPHVLPGLAVGGRFLGDGIDGREAKRLRVTGV